MITVNKNLYNGLRGIIFYKNEIIGVCDNEVTFLDILCQIKDEQSEDYKMEVEVEVSKGVKRTYTYRFSKDGKLIPSSYPGVLLWDDILNKKMLYLYNFSISHEFKRNI